jgi:uncharacterized protein YcgI (DUF1989 family)
LLVVEADEHRPNVVSVRAVKNDNADGAGGHMERTLVPARHGWSARLNAGEAFRVIDVEGSQAGDLWAYNADDLNEFHSAQHTRVHMDGIYPQVGWQFFTNRRRPILEFEEDTSPGRHDILAAACDRYRYELLGAGSEHGSCEENFQAEMKKHGFDLPWAPQPINFFANFRVRGDDGRFELGASVSKPGDSATFRVLMDAYVVISNCPQDIVPIFDNGPTDLAVEVLD